MTPTADLVRNALAAYRITRLVTEDEITEPLRQRIWKRHPVESGIGYLISCPYCTSMYAGAAVAGLSLLPLHGRTALVRDILLSALALSGAVSLYHERHEPVPSWPGG